MKNLFDLGKTKRKFNQPKNKQNKYKRKPTFIPEEDVYKDLCRVLPTMFLADNFDEILGFPARHSITDIERYLNHVKQKIALQKTDKIL